MKFSYALLGLGMMTTASVAADLPGRNAPQAPKPVATFNQPFFVGAHIGTAAAYGDNIVNDGVVRVNLRAGYQFSPLFRLETSYDVGENRYHAGTVNGIVQYPVGRFTPYALVGGGYRWTEFKNEPVFVVGGGLRYDLTRNFEIDARYRYVTDRNRERDENVVTLGVNYKF